MLWLRGSDGLEVHYQPEFVLVPHLVVAVHEHGRARRGQCGVDPAAPADYGLALIRPDPRPEPFAQGTGRGWWQLRAGELADGGLGALARRRVVPAPLNSAIARPIVRPALATLCYRKE